VSLPLLVEPSAYRHQFTFDDIEYVVENHILDWVFPDQILFIGYTSDGVLIEVIGEYEISQEGTLCFRCYHCMECSSQNAKLLEK
jgi:hypothetical protein